MLLVVQCLFGIAAASPSLELYESSDGFTFSIGTTHARWLSSAGLQYNNTALPRASSSPRRSEGSDGLGEFSATWVEYKFPNTSVTIKAITKSYPSASPGRLVAVFEIQVIDALKGIEIGAPTSQAQHEVSIAWPTFTAPSKPQIRSPELNAWTLWGPSGMFNELTRLWSPSALVNDASCGPSGNDKGCDGMGPLVVYDRNLTTLIVAPFDQFMVHNMAADSDTIRCGLRGPVKSVPTGFKLSTIIVGGNGITPTVNEWGRLMLKQYGKPAAQQVLQAAYDSDPSLRSLSYWTDAGAAYCYQTENGSSYEQMMQATKQWMEEDKIPTVSYQFDSWWYPQDSKRPGGPVTTWEPIRGVSPDSRLHGAKVIPDGFDFAWLDTTTKSGVVNHSPLIMHNRAFSPENTYNRSWFVVEEDLALPIDKALFSHIMERARPLGLKVYEQDWICLTHMKMNATQDNVHLARQWMLAMDSSAASANISIQLCMQYTRHVLQTLEMKAVTNARASTDYHAMPDPKCKYNDPNPTCTQYNVFLTGLIYSAIGIAPSKDNFRSSSVPQINGQREANPLIQSLVSALSGGPVGPSDQIGKLWLSNVHHICRGLDGYLNKPSVVATPLDLTFQLGFDDWANGLDSIEFIQHSFSEITIKHIGAEALARWHYLLAVDLNQAIQVTIQDLGLAAGSKHVAFEYFPECWRNQSAVELGHCTFELASGHTTLLNEESPLILRPGGVRGDGLTGMEDVQARPFRYVLTAPILQNGWVLLGETGKFFIATSDRFSDLAFGGDSADVDEQVGVTVHGARNERVIVELIPPGALMMSGEADTVIQTTKVRCQLSELGSARLICGREHVCSCSSAGVATPVLV